MEGQVNGTDILNYTGGPPCSSPLLNFQSGNGITVSNPSGGIVNIAAASAPQMGNPVAPTLTTNGTPGSTTYNYKVVGCQDGPTCAYHTAASSAGTIGTGNATLSGTNSINIKAYGDTLYGPRCYNMYRTVGGATQGLIGNCVGKSFIDTGLTGDGTTAPSTNTTVLDANGVTAPLPGCNKIPAAPWGIDGPPCSPTAFDDEFTWGNGTWVPGDANNPFWLQVNFTNATATLSNGMLILGYTGATGTNIRCLMEPVPGSTPWTFTVLEYIHNKDDGGEAEGGIALYEQSTGKLATWSIDTNGSTGITRSIARHWSNFTTNANSHVGAGQFPAVNGSYMAVQLDAGNTLHWQISNDGIKYIDEFTEAKTSPFTTAPSHVGVCENSNVTNASFDFDYIRRTQ